jgi:quercetin dioxygenase-like cupin family protein
MARGSKVFGSSDVSESNASSYPEKLSANGITGVSAIMQGSTSMVLISFGSCQGQSSARHAHSKQDEFVYVLEGGFVLVTDADRETVGPGTCIGFPAGTGDGHHFLNLTGNDAVFLVVGDRTAGDEVTYPDIDLEFKAGPVQSVPSQGRHRTRVWPGTDRLVGNKLIPPRIVIERTDGIPLFIEEMAKAVLEAEGEGGAAPSPNLAVPQARMRR